MEAAISVSQLEAEIKDIYVAHPNDASIRIQTHLNNRLESLPLTERIKLLEQVTVQFDPNAVPDAVPDAGKAMAPSSVQKDILADLCLLLLGEKASDMELQSEKQLEKLSGAINTIFDSLNELIDIINSTLKGTASQAETIRGLIGMHLTDETAAVSLGAHLGQIKQAFLLSREASTEAARSMVNDILAELDPEQPDRKRKPTRFSPFRKTEYFDVLAEKHKRCRHWLESDQFEEKLLRKFEKSCAKHYGE